MTFEEIWSNIIRHQEEEFETISGLLFTYHVEKNQLITNRTSFPLHKNNFLNALKELPVQGPGDFSEKIMGSSYTWAILHDKRIRE